MTATAIASMERRRTIERSQRIALMSDGDLVCHCYAPCLQEPHASPNNVYYRTILSASRPGTDDRAKLLIQPNEKSPACGRAVVRIVLRAPLARSVVFSEEVQAPTSSKAGYWSSFGLPQSRETFLVAYGAFATERKTVGDR